MPDDTHPPFSSLPNHTESFGKVPHDSETFRSVQNDSEAFGNLRHVSERKENHTMTVREVARMFEEAGVARTERSITNWCQPNKMGMARLDCYFDPNERRYFITPESARLAIEEEKAKVAKGGEMSSRSTQASETIPPTKNQENTGFRKAVGDSEDASELRKEVMDLKIANRAKDMFIDQLKTERQEIIGQLIQSSHKVGELETRLLQLDAPSHTSNKTVDLSLDNQAA